MELPAHKFHEHPLFFVDGESETDQLVRCFGCGNDICGARYSCFPCGFHLHKSCTDLPLRLEDHPFHPQHPLSLLLHHPPGCDVCGFYADGFAYRCDLCNFDLDTMCALSVYQKESIFCERIGGRDLFRYGVHQHLLMLKEEEQSDDDDYCFVCSESISAPFFSCSKSRCTFRLHKSCADLPLILRNNSFHPQHPLFLILRFSGECQLCGQVRSASYYICKPCGFSIDPRCALSNPIDNIKRMGETQIQHFTHQHLLTFLQNEAEFAEIQKRIPDEVPYCHLCKKEVASFPSYGCQLCPFILHKSCADLPAQIKTRFHLDHCLFLFARPPPPPPAGIAMSNCDCCGRDISYFNYRCVQCGFMLHVDCFISLPGSEKLYGHKHCFIKLQTFQKLTCQICGGGCHFSPWQCSSCHIIVHRKCVDLPRILKLESHHHNHHNVKLTYYLSSLHGCEGMTCRLCYKKVNVDYAAYYCSECNYGAHVKCAPLVGSVISYEENQDDQHSSKESQNITSSLVEGNKIGVIQHFSHQQHELTLMEQDLEDDKYCDGCVRLIFPPFYSCKQCNFYLHKKCGEAPRTKKHPFHDHLLTLEVVDEPDRWCDECHNSFNGFMYRCQTTKCTFRLDLECADTSEGLQHPCHEHPLFVPYTSRNYENCRGCGRMQKHVLVCSKCDDYALGYCCWRIPQVAKHRYDNHLLKLSYKTEDESGEYYCEICEEKRKPEIWFYSCSQCDFSAHIRCTVGDFPHFKHGTSLKFPSHKHPYTLVEKSKRNPPPLCKSCGKHCYSKLLECCECNLHFHFSCSCLQQADPEYWLLYL